MKRFIFITGGVVSSLGKGIASAALGALLQARGYRVRLRKLDPYLNVDPGTMSPTQHGEVFVTDDGAETDLDLGHYERFTGVSARKTDNTTTGRIYKAILEKERRGDYLGATLQVIPHVTDAIKEFIKSDTDDVDFVLCEVGGTVGDIEGLPFFEAIRQFSQDVGREASLFIHLTLLPYIATAGELKTKPTQHSVKELRSIGIQPDILLCRAPMPIPPEERRKLALFCNVRPEAVIEALDAQHIYEVPLEYHARGLDHEVLRHFGLEKQTTPDLKHWVRTSQTLRNPDGEVRIAIVGKYVALHDAYKSVVEALGHGGLANRVKVNLTWIPSDRYDDPNADLSELDSVDGVLLPGGFGERGAIGKMRAAGYARRHKLPCFGICYGMQLAVIELARLTLRDDFRTIRPEEARVVLIEAGPRVLLNFRESLSDYTKSALERLGVEVHLGEAVTNVTADTVTYGDKVLRAGTIVCNYSQRLPSSPALDRRLSCLVNEEGTPRPRSGGRSTSSGYNSATCRPPACDAARSRTAAIAPAR